MSETERAREALEKAAKWFREYEKIHHDRAVFHGLGEDAVECDRKADRNRERAEYCEAALRAALGATAAQPAEEIAKRDRMLDAIEAQLREAVEYADRCRAAIIGITGAYLRAQTTPSVPVAPSEEP